MFLKDFENEAKKDNAEGFIKSELAKELDAIKANLNKLVEEVKQKEQKTITISKNAKTKNRLN